MLKSLSILAKASALPMKTSVSVAAYWSTIRQYQGCDQAVSQIAGGIGAMFFVDVIFIELLDFSTVNDFALDFFDGAIRLLARCPHQLFPLKRRDHDHSFFPGVWIPNDHFRESLIRLRLQGPVDLEGFSDRVSH